MVNASLLQNKRILIVDDEPDVLQTLEDLLDMCVVDGASDFATAERLLKANVYDAAVLDIMGVSGFDLLKLCKEKSVPAIMLTAQALSPDFFDKAMIEGAFAYVPKDKMADIALYLEDALAARATGSEKSGAWFARLRPYFTKRFGPDWRAKSQEYWLEFENIDLILVPTDFSPYSCDAFPWAAFFATKFGARVLILHVIPQRAAQELTAIPGNPWESVLAGENAQMKEDFSACLVGDFHKKIEKETMVVTGTPQTMIVNVARQKRASMIVMASHGRTGLLDSLMGNVAEKVVRLAPCPVFVVKPKGIGIR
ncbi:MAG: universal stress protein [Desulfobacterales bacterium]|nr:MAG: universal stress protein [Desulfobacterales bacterium]